MIGDQQDIVTRMRSVLPTRWFPDEAPVLTALINGLGWAGSWTFQFLQYARAQARIASATDIWLDIIAQDYFGTHLVRRATQSDTAFRSRIQRELFRERGTRAGLVSTLHDLTGRVPIMFEPARTTDTGGYGSLIGGGGGFAYGKAGGWGSLQLPFQCFVTAFRPLGTGIANVSGWNAPAGGYGRGAIEYGTLAMMQGQVTDADIYAAIADVLPVATIGWISIVN